MKTIDLKKLAESWIKMHHTVEGSPEYTDNFWAYRQLCDLCEDEPELCFEAIEQIRSIDKSDAILSNLAAGPLEDLLSHNGELFIDRLEKLAEKDPQIRKLLGALWQNAIPDSIWKRIKIIADKSW
jgi:hypothetical protein